MAQTSFADYALAGSPPLLPAAHQLDNSALDGWEPFGTWLATVYDQARNTLGYMMRTREPQDVKDACGRRQDAIVHWRRSFPDPSTLRHRHQAGEMLPLATCMGNLEGVAEAIWTTPLEHGLVLPTWRAMMCKNVTGPVPTHPSDLTGTLISAGDPFTPGARSRGTSKSVSELWWQHQARVLDSPNSASFDDLPEHLRNFKEPFQPRPPAPEASFDSFPPSHHPFRHPPRHPIPDHPEHVAFYPEPSHLYAEPRYTSAEPMYQTLGSNATLVKYGNLVPLRRRRMPPR